MFRMRKGIICLVLLFAFVSIPFLSCVQAEKEDVGEEQITIEKGKMPAVTFPHRMHQKALGDCNSCHDLFPKKKGTIKDLVKQGTLKNQQVMNTKCISCHKDKKSAGEKAGPTKCTECHVRPK